MTAQELSTLPDGWETAGACRDVYDKDVFFESDAVAVGYALHVCRTHCPVQARCLADAEQCPPSHSQVLGGVQWVHHKRTGPPTRPSKWSIPPSSVGCNLCGSS